MLLYFMRRFTGAFATLLFLAALTFFLLRLAPGGPFDSDQAWPPEIQANILKKYELDQPVWVQFTHWIRDAARGDLRDSFQYSGQSVTSIIGDTLPISAEIGGLALFLSVLFGIPLGCVSAWKRNRWLDRSIQFFATSGVSLPSFLVASLLILFFSLYLGWLPPALWDQPMSWVLPVMTLAWRPLGMITKLTRTSMIEALGSNYVRTALGKGVSYEGVVFKHALKNSLIPVLSLVGPLLANLLTGSFLVEIAFQIPGMGKYFVQAVLNRDYPLVMGVTLVYGIVLISSNIFVDALYGLIDPRIRVGEK